MKGYRLLHLGIAFVLAMAGLTLLFLGFYAPPKGEISSAVLLAYGEVSTFAAALLGIDYGYRYRANRKHDLHVRGANDKAT